MSIIDDLATGGIGSIVKGVTDLAGDLITTDKERLAAEATLKELDIKEQEIYLGDKDSARKMQSAALGQDDIFSKRFVYYFIALWSLFAMIYLVCVTYMSIPKDNASNVSIILGFLLGTAVASIFSFLLGTTQANKTKDQTIQSLVRKE